MKQWCWKGGVIRQSMSDGPAGFARNKDKPLSRRISAISSLLIALQVDFVKLSARSFDVRDCHARPQSRPSGWSVRRTNYRNIATQSAPPYQPVEQVVGGLTPVEGVRIWKCNMGFEPASGFSKLTPPQDEAWTVSAPTPASGAPSSPASARSDRKSPTKPAPAGSGAYQRRSAGAGAARCCRRPPGAARACGHCRGRAPRRDAYRPSHTCARKYAPPLRLGGVAGDDPAAPAHAGGSHTTLSAQHASPAASRRSSEGPPFPPTAATLGAPPVSCPSPCRAVYGVRPRRGQAESATFATGCYV